MKKLKTQCTQLQNACFYGRERCFKHERHLNSSISVMISMSGRVIWFVMGVGGIVTSAVTVPHHKLMIGGLVVIFIGLKVGGGRHVVNTCKMFRLNFRPNIFLNRYIYAIDFALVLVQNFFFFFLKSASTEHNMLKLIFLTVQLKIHQVSVNNPSYQYMQLSHLMKTTSSGCDHSLILFNNL